ncbi:hypothetical protein HN51_063078 [Arachis hypogaea]
MSHSKEDECYTEEEENENNNDKTIDGKEAAVLSANDFLNQQFDGERSILMRIGALSVATSRMIYLGGRKLSHFRYTMNEICRVTKDLEAKLEQTILPEKGNKVGDPSVAKSKGAPKVQKDENKRRQCSNCNQTGHTKRKCIEKIAEKDVQHNDRMVREDEFEDGVESVCIPNDQTPIASFVEVNVKNIHFWSEKKNPQLSQEDISKVYTSGSSSTFFGGDSNHTSASYETSLYGPIPSHR